MFNQIQLSKDELARILETSPEILERFEQSYRLNILPNTPCSRNQPEHPPVAMSDFLERIVDELMGQTKTFHFDGNLEHRTQEYLCFPGPEGVSKEELEAIPLGGRPQLTGNLVCRDTPGDSASAALFFYNEYLKTGDKEFYHLFRQGLDILDLDPIIYEILGTNPNSIGHWFPQLVEACRDQDFFQIPATTIAKVPITLLQLSRVGYENLNPTTLKIVDMWAEKAFKLDRPKEYFIKTGTYSSKFDFRNAYVHGEKEVRELGEYLLYIQCEANRMASPLNTPSIYGVSTTNEWVVREFIHDKEANPCIYKGLPLHTEYRVFVDCDTDKILGTFEYWDPELMKNRFSNYSDASSPHQIHDYMTFRAHEKTMGERFRKNAGRVAAEIAKLLPNLDLEGQWSIDVMQNGDDFWIIDMAVAQDSAFFEKVPEELRGEKKENWIPKIEGK